MPEASQEGRPTEVRPSFSRAALFFVIAIVLIASSVQFGKEALASEIPYDIGIAFLTVVLVEIGIRKLIQNISTSWGQLLGEEAARRERERVTLEQQAVLLAQISEEIRRLSERTRSGEEQARRMTSALEAMARQADRSGTANDAPPVRASEDQRGRAS
ncbi:MAG: hypothetical protein KY456_16600 [Chloroflexi bacterium]|nr:hypothetical protein [Chloroflexota bacterium]